VEIINAFDSGELLNVVNAPKQPEDRQVAPGGVAR
jgi:hypothetical protein